MFIGDAEGRRYRAAIDDATDQRDAPFGALRINCSSGAARRILEPLILPFPERYPAVSVDLVTESRLIDIVAQGFDAGIRQAGLVPTGMTGVLISSPVDASSWRHRPTLPAERHRVFRPTFSIMRKRRPSKLQPARLLRNETVNCSFQSGKEAGNNNGHERKHFARASGTTEPKIGHIANRNDRAARLTGSTQASKIAGDSQSALAVSLVSRPLFVQIGQLSMNAARIFVGALGLSAMFCGSTPMIVPICFHPDWLAEQLANITDLDQLFAISRQYWTRLQSING